jgi:hypothetical protein
VCTDFECDLVEFNGEHNHVHLLVNFPPKVAVTKPANSLKGVSSRRLRQEFPDLVRHYWRTNKPWSGSYPAGTSAAPALPGPAVHRTAEPARVSTNPPGEALPALRAADEEPGVSGSAGPESATLRVATVRFASPPA